MFDEVYGLFDKMYFHFHSCYLMNFGETRFTMHGQSFFVCGAALVLSYLSLSFIVLLVDTNIYRSLRELD
jgi:hypothetical protein